eukprot:CAMPEP_0181299786 /NCGR_PEP_ID=MMETSP1101-20121128/6537_1 /TAXON_ID=46948 /ORGANISM="Rhodomonas abbreviata, Strain Caron Lab Isolate" /LENGTH=349 /DNA_ID=CAMNT_0023404969 /DNA_START=354 /DNA_END=1403 /DNA_ORIENTATION=+
MGGAADLPPSGGTNDETLKQGLQKGDTQKSSSSPNSFRNNMFTFGIFGSFVAFIVSYISSAQGYSPLATFLTAGLAAMTAEFCTFPFDAFKARRQLSTGDVKGVEDQGSLLSNLPTLYYGVGAACMRTLPYSGMRLMFYEQLRNLFLSLPAFAASSSAPPVLLLAGIAMMSGACAQCIVSPVDLLKIRMQNDGRRVRRGEPPVYAGLGDALKRVWKEEGLNRMWTGATPNVLRACCTNVGDQAAYDVAKRAGMAMFGAGFAPVAFASCVTGITVALLACPADTMRSKMMNHGPSAPQPLYTSLPDCFAKTYRAGGISAFYAAVMPMYMREAPYYIIFWLTLEGLKSLRP